jgi:hypothetical protein
MTAFLLWRRRHKRYEGELGLLLLVIFSVSSAMLEPLRADDPLRAYWGPWPQLLWASMAMAGLSTAVLALAEYRYRQ